MKAILLALALVGCALAMPVNVPLVITDYSSVVESKNLVPVEKLAEPAPVKEIAVENAPAVEAAADSPVASMPLAPVPAVVDEALPAESAIVQDPLVETPLKEVAELVKEEEIKPLLTESEETKLEEPIPEASQPLEAIKDAVPESIPVFVEAVPNVLAHDLPAAAEEAPIAAETVMEEIKATELSIEEAAVTAAPIAEDAKVADASIAEEVKVADAPVKEVKVIEAPVEEVKVAEVIPEEVKVADAPVEDVKVSEVIVEEVKVVAPIADEASNPEVFPTFVADALEEKPIEASAEEIKEEVLAEAAPEAEKLTPRESEIVEQMDAKLVEIPVTVIAESKPFEIPVVETVVEVEHVAAADEQVESKPEEAAELIVEKVEEKPEEKPVKEAIVADEKVVELKPEETIAVEVVEKKPEVLAVSDEAVVPAASLPEVAKFEDAAALAPATVEPAEEAKITAAPLEEALAISSEALKPEAAIEKLEAVVSRRRRGLEGKLDEIKKPTGATKKDDSKIKGEKKPKSEDVKVAVFETVVAEEAVPFADTPAVEEVVPVVLADKIKSST